MKSRPDTAVVDDTHFYTPFEKIPHDEIGDLEELMQASLDHNFTHVWIVAGCQLSQDAQHIIAIGPAPGRWWDIYRSTGKKGIKFARGWRTDHQGETIYVGFPEFHNWPWKGCDNWRTLLATLTYLEIALGLPIEWGPGHMSIELLKKMNQGSRYSWLTPMKMDLEEYFPLDETCKQIHWKSNLIVPGRYLSKYDKNSMYMAAATGLYVGEGDPVHTVANYFDGKRPGFWKVSIEKGDLVEAGDTSFLPTFEWMTTDMVNCLRHFGYIVTVWQGYWWEIAHRTIESTAHTFWQLRQRFKEAAGMHPQAAANVYASISEMAHILPGKLGSGEKVEARLRRRDIWAEIESRAIANILYNIHSIWAESNLWPCLIDVDALWYFSDEKDPLEALEGLVDTTKLGGFKHEYTLENTREIEESFETMTPGKLVSKLNALAGV